ncbi:FAD-binding oxidoreductase [Oceaniglobus ichthyenteri]|uniref:FAD-binding oxidoreductase n=1 Tax=Oceaniglobus ichthyenteri TaxID=2136177 RepID=UPI000D334588|nr:FAD-binding oxidoreductase [Oceaniglobus ichthyenteri]
MRWKTANYAGWGRALRATGQLARPERLSTLTALMADEPAPAIGNCRSYGDACLNHGRQAVQMLRMDRIAAFDPTTGIATVEAGVQLGELARVFAPRGWLPAVMPGTGFATVGGAIAHDVHGKNHHVAGSFGQHVRAITLIGIDGTSRRITPDDPLFAATVGGLGQTGIIASAELQLLKCKGDVIVVTERRIAGWDDFLAHFDASDASYSVGWIDATAQGDSLGRGILEEAETGSGLVTQKGGAKAVPFDAPGFALSPAVVRLFNAAYFRRVPDKGRTVVKPIQDFFFPLDRIRDWNRLYGKEGFHQFQCVVPVAQAPALRAMLGRIAKSGLASPLAVLKRMGPGRAGLMSFPMEGYTLAIDFPNRAKATRLIGELEADTLAAGGRIYLAKDSLAKGSSLRAMYPEHATWAAAANAADPDGVLATDLIRRLDLRTI